MLPGATFSGLGGPLMQLAGQTRIVRAEDVAHMGITEILRHAPRVFAHYRRLVRHIQQTKPAVAVLIDFPDVNFRLAKHCKRLGIPVVWFVSPQLWAWKRRRLRWVKQRVSKMLVIFPFEAAFYRKREVDATFVGHPLAALPEPTISRESYAAHHNLDPAKPWVALLPGSRWSEIDRHLPTMVEMACRHPAVGGSQGVEYILPVAATLAVGEARKRLADFVSGWITHYPGTDPGVPLPYIHLVDGAEAAREALHHAHASVVASGTATVQAALIGNPFVVVYKVSAVTFKLAKSLIWYPEEIWPAHEAPTQYPDREGNLPIAMPNLIAARRIVPELLQAAFNPDQLARTLAPLLADTPTRHRQQADLREIRQLLTTSGPPPIHQVRDHVLSLLPSSLLPRLN